MNNVEFKVIYFKMKIHYNKIKYGMPESQWK